MLEGRFCVSCAAENFWLLHTLVLILVKESSYGAGNLRSIHVRHAIVKKYYLVHSNIVFD